MKTEIEFMPDPSQLVGNARMERVFIAWTITADRIEQTENTGTVFPRVSGRAVDRMTLKHTELTANEAATLTATINHHIKKQLRVVQAFMDREAERFNLIEAQNAA